MMRESTSRTLFAGILGICIGVIACMETAHVLAQQPGSGAQAPTPGGSFQSGAHEMAGGPAPAASACGTLPVVTGNDIAGYVAVGGGATACTLTFAAPYTGVAPACSVDPYNVLSSFTVSRTAINITATAAGAIITWNCIGLLG